MRRAKASREALNAIAEIALWNQRYMGQMLDAELNKHTGMATRVVPAISGLQKLRLSARRCRFIDRLLANQPVIAPGHGARSA